MQEIRGTSGSPGLALGHARIILRRLPALEHAAHEPHHEVSLFEAALVLARDEIDVLRDRAAESDKGIFSFQSELLRDPSFVGEARRQIDEGVSAAKAVENASQLFAGRIAQLPDEYLAERTVDIQDACRRVSDILEGRPHGRLTLQLPSVVIADELLPSDLVSVDRAKLLGIVMAGGSTLSHACIIAHTFGIPAVVAAGPDALCIPDGALCAVDGAAGLVVADPDEATYARFAHRINLSKRRSVSFEKMLAAPSKTKDGVPFSLMANCTEPDDIRLAMELGAEGVGLLRTEYLFMNGSLPDEDRQTAFYVDCIRAAGGRPVTIRTFDAGADKIIPGLTREEPNPALGLRGIRFQLAHPGLLRTQLRALFRAGLEGPLRVMFPMISAPDDLLRAMDAVRGAQAELTSRGEPFSNSLKFGMMIETPAAALTADEFAGRCSFFSIGTNDLAQYTHAADRVNPDVSSYYLPASAAMMRLIRGTVLAANAADIDVCVCGEAAADPDVAVKYLRAGVRCLSVAAPSIAPVKESLLQATILED